MKKYIFSILFCLFAFGMTSCTPEEVQMTDKEQSIEASASSDPTSEGAGEEDELEDN